MIATTHTNNSYKNYRYVNVILLILLVSVSFGSLSLVSFYATATITSSTISSTTKKSTVNNNPYYYDTSLTSSSSRSSSSSSSSSSTGSIYNDGVRLEHKLPLHGTKIDPFVQESPLIVAVVCKDGIAIVAAHTPVSGDDDVGNEYEKNESKELYQSSSIPTTATTIDVDDNKNKMWLDPLLYYRPTDRRMPKKGDLEQRRKNNNNNNNNDDNPLLFTSEIDRDSDNNYDDNDNEDNDTDEVFSIPFLDLPIDFGGPFRIVPIIGTTKSSKSKSNNYNYNNNIDVSVIASCGWRADCYSIIDKCNTIIDTEKKQFGLPSSTLFQKERQQQRRRRRQQQQQYNYNNNHNDNIADITVDDNDIDNDIDTDFFNIVSYDYYYRLVNELSFYMAQCAVSDRVRALSCVSFLATTTVGPPHCHSTSSSSSNNNNYDNSFKRKKDTRNDRPCLWLIDSTGAYRVYAHCIGGGALPIEIRKQLQFSESVSAAGLDVTDEEKTRAKSIPTTVAEFMNMRLLKEYFSTISVQSSPTTTTTTTTTTTQKRHVGFDEISAEEGLKRLVLMLANKDQLYNDDDNENENDDNYDIDNTNNPDTTTGHDSGGVGHRRGRGRRRQSFTPMQPPSIPIVRPNTRLELGILHCHNNNVDDRRMESNVFFRRKLQDLGL